MAALCKDTVMQHNAQFCAVWPFGYILPGGNDSYTYTRLWYVHSDSKPLLSLTCAIFHPKATHCCLSKTCAGLNCCTNKDFRVKRKIHSECRNCYNLTLAWQTTRHFSMKEPRKYMAFYLITVAAGAISSSIFSTILSPFFQPWINSLFKFGMLWSSIF